MKTEKEVRERVDELTHLIDADLDASTTDPLKQWASMKTLHAMRVALEWVIE